jgi:thiamine phosphate phosphatase / amino-HMP aminohydrolase
MSSSRPELWIFTDWDETIASKDTLALIAPPDPAEPGAPPPFSFFVDYYMQVSRDFEKSFGPRNTLQRQLEFLDSIKVVEKASVSKIEEYGLFRGVTNSDLCERAKQVTFREGWKEFTEKVMESEDAQLLAVLSVNWSAVFIECALRRIHDDAFIKQIEIRANVSVSHSIQSEYRMSKWTLREGELGCLPKRKMTESALGTTN